MAMRYIHEQSKAYIETCYLEIYYFDRQQS